MTVRTDGLPHLPNNNVPPSSDLSPSHQHSPHTYILRLTSIYDLQTPHSDLDFVSDPSDRVLNFVLEFLLGLDFVQFLRA